MNKQILMVSFINKSVIFNDFNQFYNLMVNVNKLNEDLWYLIYKISQPNFKKNNICELKIAPNINKYCKIKIYDVYYHYKLNQYLYSFHYFNSNINGISFYAIENDLQICKN